MTRFKVCAASSIPEGGRLKVDINGRTIVVFNVKGKFYALADRCPHQGGPLSEGDQIGELQAKTPGDHQYCRRNMTIRCPWHHWEFDIETGQSRIDPNRLRIRTFETVVENAGPNGIDPDCAEPENLQATVFETVNDRGMLYVMM